MQTIIHHRMDLTTHITECDIDISMSWMGKYNDDDRQCLKQVGQMFNRSIRMYRRNRLHTRRVWANVVLWIISAVSFGMLFWMFADCYHTKHHSFTSYNMLDDLVQCMPVVTFPKSNEYTDILIHEHMKSEIINGHTFNVDSMIDYARELKESYAHTYIQFAGRPRISMTNLVYSFAHISYVGKDLHNMIHIIEHMFTNVHDAVFGLIHGNINIYLLTTICGHATVIVSAIVLCLYTRKIYTYVHTKLVDALTSSPNSAIFTPDRTHGITCKLVVVEILNGPTQIVMFRDIVDFINKHPCKLCD